jgi:CRP-like cAMP-binding protein
MTETGAAIVTEAKLTRTLAGIRLLADLDADAIAGVEEICRWRRYQSGERLFARGSLGREVFFIVQGSVQILGVADTGREITLANVGAGDTVGEMAAIDGQPRSANVLATEDSLVAVLDAESFVVLLKQFGTISFVLLQRLSMMVRESGDRVVELSVLEAKQRVCREILRLSKLVPSVADLWGIEPLPPLRQIAGGAGTTREIAANTLGQLYARNIANRKGDNLYITDRKALEEFARATL